MQVHHKDDIPDEFLNGFPTVTQEQMMAEFINAMQNPSVEAVTFHKPGRRVETKSGTVYEVQEDGSWKNISEIEKSGRHK